MERWRMERGTSPRGKGKTTGGERYGVSNLYGCLKIDTDLPSNDKVRKTFSRNNN